TLTLEVTGLISGIVVDPQGQPIDGAQVAAIAHRGASDPLPALARPSARERTDASGKFVLTGLAPGEYALAAAMTAGRSDHDSAHGKAVAATGDASVRIVVIPDGGVKGHVAFSDGAPPRLFSVTAGHVEQSFVDPGGEFVLEGLPAGAYRLEIRGPQFQ